MVFHSAGVDVDVMIWLGCWAYTGRTTVSMLQLSAAAVWLISHAVPLDCHQRVMHVARQRYELPGAWIQLHRVVIYAVAWMCVTRRKQHQPGITTNAVAWMCVFDAVAGMLWWYSTMTAIFVYHRADGHATFTRCNQVW